MTASNLGVDDIIAAFAQPPSEIDLYLILGVERDATTTQITRAYHKRSLHVHPDKVQHPKAHEAFSLLNRAAEILKDDEKRNMYDSEGFEAVARLERGERQMSWKEWIKLGGHIAADHFSWMVRAPRQFRPPPPPPPPPEASTEEKEAYEAQFGPDLNVLPEETRKRCWGFSCLLLVLVTSSLFLNAPERKGPPRTSQDDSLSAEATLHQRCEILFAAEARDAGMFPPVLLPRPMPAMTHRSRWRSKSSTTTVDKLERKGMLTMDRDELELLSGDSVVEENATTPSASTQPPAEKRRMKHIHRALVGSALGLPYRRAKHPPVRGFVQRKFYKATSASSGRPSVFDAAETDDEAMTKMKKLSDVRREVTSRFAARYEKTKGSIMRGAYGTSMDQQWRKECHEKRKNRS